MKKLLWMIVLILVSHSYLLSQSDNTAPKQANPLFKIEVGQGGEVLSIQPLQAASTKVEAVDNNRNSLLLNAGGSSASANVRMPNGSPVDLNKRSPKDPYRIGEIVDVKLTIDPAELVPVQSTAGLRKNSPVSSPGNTEAWQTIMTEDFEGTFPSTGWTVGSGTGAASAYWGKVSNQKYAGSWSMWCAAAGSSAGAIGGNYPNNMSSKAIYGPFSLSGTTDANLQFYYKINSEATYDYVAWMASIDGSNFYGSGYTGSNTGWSAGTFDLKSVTTLGNITGSPQVWIMFFFYSDASNTDLGAFIDNVLLQKSVNSLPDLAWTTMSLSATTWPVGSSISVTLTEANGGTVSAGAHQTQLYLSVDNTVSTSDTPLGTPINFTAIAAGGTQVQTKTFTVPNVAPGTYYVGALVDINNAVAELDETNNGGTRSGTITVPPSNPDLAWTYLAVSTETWVRGVTSVTGSLKEKNYGTVSAGSHRSQLYLSVDSIVTTSDTPLGSPVSFTSIAAGDSQTQTFSFTAPNVSVGSYFMGALVDIDGSVTETDETNNAGSRIGKITVTEPVSNNVTGSVKYNNTARSAISNASVTMNSQTLTSSSSGGYSFSNVPNGTYAVRAAKTGAGSGVNSTDALLIARHFVRIQTITDTLYMRGADVNTDGVVNATDALLVLRRSVGLDQSFPQGEWIFTRPSVTVNSGSATQDIYGMCVGDVNGSSTPSGSYYAKMIAATALKLEADGRDVAPKRSIIEIPLRINEDVEIGALQMRLVHPANLGKYAGMTSGLAGLVANNGEGGLVLGWADLSGAGRKFRAGEEIARIRYELGDVDGLFRLEADDAEIVNGSATPYSVVSLAVREVEVGSLPAEFSLGQNYPNPFNPATTIHYSLGKAGRVRLMVYDIIGRLVTTLVDEDKVAGTYSAVWDAAALSSGTYVCKMTVEYEGQIFMANKSLMLLK